MYYIILQYKCKDTQFSNILHLARSEGGVSSTGHITLSSLVIRPSVEAPQEASMSTRPSVRPENLCFSVSKVTVILNQ